LSSWLVQELREDVLHLRLGKGSRIELFGSCHVGCGG
jgi:hypothetical protein